MKNAFSAIFDLLIFAIMVMAFDVKNGQIAVTDFWITFGCCCIGLILAEWVFRIATEEN
jgi:hypothetical protein